jgi:hypothetical protein
MCHMPAHLILLIFFLTRYLVSSTDHKTHHYVDSSISQIPHPS